MAGASIFIFALVATLLSACTSGAGDGTITPSRTPGSREPIRLDVFVYNVEYGGDASTDSVIRSIDADIVGVLESYNRLPEIAESTGYPFYNPSLQILSKYPIHEPSGSEGRYALIEVRPGSVIAFFNIHLDYVAYGPRLLRRGASVQDVIASENEVRTSALDVPLRLMAELIEQGYPVFLTGDFNEPSSLDYSEATAGSRPDIDEPVPWPVSEALFEVGLRDAYRDIYPDPLENPGITHQGAGDRIDYIYAAGPSETLHSDLVGENGGADVSIGFDTWTSDHRAVLSRFEVTPVPMPTMVSVDRTLLDRGDPLTIAFHAPDPGGTLAIVRSGGDVSSPALREPATGSSGGSTVDTSDLAPGSYDAVLLGADGSEVSRVAFWLRDPTARVQVSTDASSYEAGEPIVVSWTDGPANRWDWIGIYEAPRSDPKVDDLLLWNYTGLHTSGTVPPSVDGSVTIDGNAQGRPWPLPQGAYVVHYLLTDRYRSAGSATFEVTG